MGVIKTPNWMHGKYAHIRIPKALINSESFHMLSPEAILLYGAMMDRTSLSIQFGGKKFISKSNEVTIIFTQKEIMQMLRCKRDKARAVTQELVSSNLITLNRNNKRGPYRITVIPQNWANFDLKRKKVDIYTPSLTPDNPSINDGKTDNSRGENIDLNNTNPNNTDFNNPAQRSREFLDLSVLDLLLDVYESAHINRVSEVLEGLFSNPPEIVYIHGKEMDWRTISSLFCAFTKKDYEFVFRKMKKAKYTSEFSDTFILDALYSASIIHSESNITTIRRPI